MPGCTMRMPNPRLHVLLQHAYAEPKIVHALFYVMCVNADCAEHVYYINDVNG